MLAWGLIRLPCVKGAPPKAVRDCLLFETGDTKRKSVLTVWAALLQRFCKAQTDTPLFFDTKGANEKGTRKRFSKRNAAWSVSLARRATRLAQP